MKTCKDCVHLDVCEATYAELMYAGVGTFMDDSENVDKDCRFFKDNTKLIELPCSVGDITYAIFSEENSEIIKIQVSMIEVQPTYHRIWIQDIKNPNNVWWITDALYNDLANFHTREEAEKKLEEMQNEKE